MVMLTCQNDIFRRSGFFFCTLSLCSFLLTLEHHHGGKLGIDVETYVHRISTLLLFAEPVCATNHTQPRAHMQGTHNMEKGEEQKTV